MLHSSIQLVYSPIEGKGLVAKKRIPKGSVVWKLSPNDKMHVYSLREYKAFTARYRKIIDRYSYPDTKGNYVYSLEYDRFWNHSCNANTQDAAEENTIIAIRTIEPGEEVTYDYGKNLRKGLEFACNCGESNCRKVVRHF